MRNHDLPEAARLDALLVAHLIAEHLTSEDGLRAAEISTERQDQSNEDLTLPLQALFSLSSTSSAAGHPPLPPISSAILPSTKTIDHLFSSIGSNHWVVTSTYLHSIANAVFPLASRSFNHSCVPNASPSYRMETGQLGMDVRALGPIARDEEVSVHCIIRLRNWSRPTFNLPDHSHLCRPSPPAPAPP